MKTEIPKRTVRFRISRSSIKVEKNKPLPSDVDDGSGRSVYPFADLKVGQSFSFPYASKLKQAMYNAVMASIRPYMIKNPRQRFVARIIENEGVIRVWRLKDLPK